MLAGVGLYGVYLKVDKRLEVVIPYWSARDTRTLSEPAGTAKPAGAAHTH